MSNLKLVIMLFKCGLLVLHEESQAGSEEPLHIISTVTMIIIRSVARVFTREFPCLCNVA